MWRRKNDVISEKLHFHFLVLTYLIVINSLTRSFYSPTHNYCNNTENNFSVPQLYTALQNECSLLLFDNQVRNCYQ